MSSITLLEGILLGAVQGLTEFLPVSSSAHLILARTYFNIGDLPLLFDVLLHVATLFVIVFHYRELVAKLIISFFKLLRRKNTADDQNNLTLIWALVVATATTVAVALIFKKLKIEATSIVAVSILLLVTATILFSTRYVSFFVKQPKKLNLKSAAVVGVAQGFGTLAGISRSGITISASLFSGLKRQEAGDFAFLLSIPAILGALVLTLFENGQTVSIAVFPTIVACISAFLVGLVTLKVLLWMIRSARLWYFSIYLVIVGTFGLLSTL